MADVKWIKIVTDIFDDEKILLIESLPEADSIIVIWFKLLCLAGKQNNCGVFVMSNGIPYTEQMISTIFRRKESTVQLALRTFEQFGMIEIVNNAVTIPNWDKHQTLDSYEKKKARDRIYQSERREKQRLLIESSDKSSDVAISEEEIEEEIEEDKDIEKKEIKARSRFTPPSLEEVTDYCKERNNGIDPQHFIDFYAVRGWKLSSGVAMKDWKAGVRTWEQRDNARKGGAMNARSDSAENQWSGLNITKLG